MDTKRKTCGECKLTTETAILNAVHCQLHSNFVLKCKDTYACDYFVEKEHGKTR